MDQEIVTLPQKNSKLAITKKASQMVVFLREFIAALIWFFVFVKLFIYDIDYYLLSLFSTSLATILEYKFFILLGVIASSWLILGNKRFKEFLLVLIFLPFIIIFWRFPKMFWKSKSWIGIFTSLSLIFSFFSSFRRNFFIFTIFSISTLLIFISNSKFMLALSVVILLSVLTYHFIRKMKYSLKPSHIFSKQSEAIIRIWKKYRDKLELANELKDLKYQDMSKEQYQKWSLHLQFMVLINRLCLFITSKLRNFQKSNVNVVFYIFSIFYTVFFTVFVFALINYAFYKIDHNSFNSLPKGNFFFFIYYSFNTLFTNSINDFYPISSIARIINLLEVLYAFTLFAILVFLVTTILRDKHNEEINTAIISVNNQAEELDLFVQQEFNMNISAAITTIKNIEGSLIQLIFYLSGNLEEE